MNPWCGRGKALRFLLAGMAILCAQALAANTDPLPRGGQERIVRVAADGHNIAPLWRQARHGEVGTTTVKGVETGVLIQMEGDSWRHLHNGPLTWIGGALLLAVAISIAIFHRRKGQLRLSAAPTGRRLQRFSRFERAVHNTVAVCFVLLAAGGMLLLFGKHVLMPLFGHGLVTLLMQVMKPIHNFLGLAFALALLVMIAMWARDNLWAAVDAQWIRRAGGLVDHTHVPSWRFNFGEKTWFWFGVTLLGLIVVASGLLLDFPAILAARSALQIANLTHAIGAVLMLLLSFGHIYMGTAGVEGAFEAMTTGEVDEVWAKDHHALWYQQVAGKSD